MKKVRAHIFVSGFVQGIGFRFRFAMKARMLSVSGWARNLPDGRVEAVLEGNEPEVVKMLNWAKQGPILAKVKDLKVEFKEYQGEFDDFKIIYAR